MTRPHRSHPLASALATAASAVLLFAAALAPGVIASGSALAFVRIPLVVVLALAVLAFVPWRWPRRVLAVLAALVLVLVALSAALDRVFTATVGRPFDIVSGWSELVDGYGVVQDSAGAVGASLLLLLVAVVSVAAVVAITAAFLRLARLLGRRRRATALGASAVTAGWLVVALVGAQLLPGEPVAASDPLPSAAARVEQVEAAGRDQAVFAREAATDPYAALPASRLLTGLQGKDVIVAFVESYGQVAVQGTPFSSGVDAVLRDGDAQLAAHGYSARSGWLTSPTFGGVSWLAHSTLQTGLWIDTQQKYDRVTSGDRFTLATAFRKAGWDTVSDVPSDTRPWPVGRDFYRFGTQLNAKNVGYRGPTFSYARVPDQYTWSYFDRTVLARPHRPLLAEIDLVSSHTPWTPLPKLVPWDTIGDGSVYDPQPAEGLSPDVVWQSPQHVQQLYGQSVEYSLGSLFSFLTETKDPNLVLVVLGDHQPATVVSGEGANHEVPISVIAKDPTVMDRIDSWHWDPGMLPSAGAPVWPMDAFRDRFLDAFGTPPGR